MKSAENLVVTVTRKLTAIVEERLQSLFEVKLNLNDEPFSSERYKHALKNSDALICTVSDRLGSDVLSVENKRVKIISNFGVGYSNIDIDAAKREGLVVTNTPDVLTDATADIALLLMLASTRRAYASESILRNGDWREFSIIEGLGVSLQGKTLGIIGMGRIGQAVARRAVLGFEMNVIYFNRSIVSGLDFSATAYPDLASVMKEADIVSLHTPGMGNEGPMITEELIATMKTEAHLINTSRGDVIDEPALIGALSTGKIAGAGLDVFADEPRVPNALLEMKNVTLLPHIGSATREVRDAMGMLAVDNVVAHFGDQNYPSRVA